MNSGKIILGALAGIAAGALIGVLFAPDKGSESRHKIVKKGEDYLDSVKKKFNTLLDTISGKADGGKVTVSDINANEARGSGETIREMQASGA
jgi:gas vesicle protein